MIDTCHFEIHVHSIAEAEAFYVGILGFVVLQRLPAAGLLAVRAGPVRISIFGGATREELQRAAGVGGHIIFRTDDLADAIATLERAGIAVG